MREKTNTKKLTTIGILSSIAFVLMFLEAPVPLMPSFLKLDLSEIPILIGTFAMGPLAGICIELIKNLLHLPISKTLGIGELANFLVGISYIVPAGMLYRKSSDVRGLLKGMAAGVVTMSAFATVANYFIFLPLYASIVYHVKVEDFVGYAAVPYIQNVFSLLVLGILPFNLLKGIVLSTITAFVYGKLAHFVHARQHDLQNS